MKFSIRDLLLVTVIAALAVAWWVDRVERSRLQRENVRLFRENNFLKVQYLDEKKLMQQRHTWLSRR